MPDIWDRGAAGCRGAHRTITLCAGGSNRFSRPGGILGNPPAPPACDSVDGLVVMAARAALEAGNVDIVLQYVPPEGEAEVVETFKKVTPLRDAGAAAREVAELYFFDTVVRLHCAGEGAPYTGLKPPGLDEAPLAAVIENAMATGYVGDLQDTLVIAIRQQLRKRFDHAMHLKALSARSADDARKCADAEIRLAAYARRLYRSAMCEPLQAAQQHG